MQTTNTSRKTKLKIISFAFEFGFIIALPIVIFLLAGKYLDDRLGTAPYLKILGVLLAIITTTIWLTRRFAEILKAMSSGSGADKTQEGGGEG
ncbi:MAG: AtpZ/AtpI family protein [Candidatus Doudnabacteria bacterium]|nr:AtpZ/AtpI family protein [Candidatus Doudnabacteria bacterium]